MPMVAHASSGTIAFTRAVAAQTCQISGQSGSQNNFSVKLSTVPAASLSSAGQTAGQTSFSITLTGCSGGEKVHTFFEAGATIDPSTGNLIVAQGNGNATNVSAA